jgi:hypothetical protein
MQGHLGLLNESHTRRDDPSDNLSRNETDILLKMEHWYRILATSRQYYKDSTAIPPLEDVLPHINDLCSSNRDSEALKTLNSAIDLRIMALDSLESKYVKHELRKCLMILIFNRAFILVNKAERLRNSAIIDLLMPGTFVLLTWEDTVYLMQCSMDSEMQPTIMSQSFYDELAALNSRVTLLSNSISFLPTALANSQTPTITPKVYIKRSGRKKGRKTQNPLNSQSDSTIDVDVFPCELLTELQVGSNTGADSWCPICQTNCKYPF